MPVGLLLLLLTAAGGATPAPLPRPATAADVLGAVEASKGKVVLVNAWATWCVPCREEMPDLVRLRSELGPRGFELVLVSTDFPESVAEARTFLGSLGASFRTWHKTQPDHEFIEGLDPSWSGSLPFTMLYDRSGRRVASWEGKETHAQLKERILPLLSPQGEKP